jgi:tetratricopeptide (TPR) repeat protein
MKKCPFCDNWNMDEVIQCRKCHEWLDLEPTPRKKVSVTSTDKKQGEAESNAFQKKIIKILKDYKIVIIAMIGLLLIFILQRPDKNIMDGKKEINKSPEVVVPANPAMPPASMPESVETSNAANDLYNKALALCSSGRCTDPLLAIQYLDDAIKLKPDLARAYNNRGNAYSDLGQDQRAIQEYNEAIRLNPDYTDAYGNRGVVYERLGQRNLAMEDYNKAILLNPNFGNALLNRGNAYLIQNNKELACIDLQKACDLGICSGLQDAKNNGKCQ